MRYFSFFLLAFLFSALSFACSEDGRSGFLPKNDLFLPAGPHIGKSNIDEQQFNKIIDKFSVVFAPIASNLGGNLVVNKLWEEATVNADVGIDGNRWNLNVYGGIARHPDITQDGLALVICHELGHLIGGAPKMSSKRPRTPWSSSEGQADYFATLKCLRHLFLNDNNSQIISKAIIPNALKQGCLKSHPNKDDRDICIRSGLAASTVTKFFSALEKVPAPKFETPDLEVVAETNDFHPNSQCRLDTFFAGALCDRSLNENLSQEDEVPSTCHSLLGDVIGLRPRCWFKPREG